MYLVIDSMNKKGQKFKTFLDLNKLHVKNELQYFVNHIEFFEDNVILKVSFSKERLSNW